MIIIEDVGIILKLVKYSEKDAVIWVFSKNHGIMQGYIKSYRSKHNASTVLCGNLVEFIWQARLEEHLGYFKIEIKKHYHALFIEDRKKTTAVLSLFNLLKQTLAERNKEENLFDQLLILLDKISTSNDWIVDFIKFELFLLSNLGFGLDLSKCVATNNTENLTFISPKSAKAVSFDAGNIYKHLLMPLPKFFINNNHIPDEEEIFQALKITKYFIQKFLLAPANFKECQIRIQLLNLFKPKNK